MALEMKPVVSSNIAGIGYDKEESRLCIQFQNGKCYEYAGVPAEAFVDLITAKSTGKAFHALIKNGGFEFKQIELSDV